MTLSDLVVVVVTSSVHLVTATDAWVVDAGLPLFPLLVDAVRAERAEVAIPSIALHLAPLIQVLHPQGEDDRSPVEHEENEKRANTAPVGVVVNAELVELRLRLLLNFLALVRNGELHEHHAVEAEAHGGEEHEPRDELLWRLLEDALQVDHVASEQVDWRVDCWCDGRGGCLCLEEGGDHVAEGGGHLDGEHENEVEGHEIAELVLEADREVAQDVHEHGDDEHDWLLGEEFSRRVHPDVVHASIALSHINRLLLLEDNDSALEVEEHRDECDEVDGTSHVLNISWVVLKVVNHPEDGHHHNANDEGLHDLSTRETWLVPHQVHTSEHELFDLNTDGGSVV